MEAQLSTTMGWDFERTVEKEFTTSYNTTGAADVAVIYTVPYVRYNAQIFVPSYKLPAKEEYEAKKAFCEELKKNIERYQDIKASVVGGAYAKPNDGYNDAYTTNVTKDSYGYQIRTCQNYLEWLQQTESQMEGFEGSRGLPWGQEVTGGWEEYFFCVPQTPIITSISTDAYDEIASGCKDLQSLYGTALPSGYVAGRPETYASNIAELKERTTVDEGSVEDGKTNAGENGELGDGFISSTAMSAASSAPSQTIAFTEENAKSFSVGVGVSLEVTVTMGEAKGGVAVSTDNEASWSRATTKGCEFSGQVPNLPKRPDYMTEKQYANYDYRWRLVAYEAKVNGANVPVVGYYTRYADRNLIPPSPVSNLELAEVKSDSITLTWNAGSRKADHYNIYQASGSGSGKKYEKLTSVPALESEDGTYRFTHKNLKADQPYAYVAAACNKDESLISVYSDEVKTTTPVPEFDVKLTLEGLNSEETCLAGKEQTLTASLVTANYPQSEVDQYFWQVNDGKRWKKIPNSENQDSYTWQASAKADGYQYRCGAYVAINGRLYRLYSDAVTLHVRKAQVQVQISADKKEGAADRSSEFGLAVYNGDILKLTAQVTAEAGAEPAGSLEFVVASLEDASNVREYGAQVSNEGVAQAECRFSKEGKYAITARYLETEAIQGAVSGNSLPYYAYNVSQKEDRIQGQGMEDRIYEKDWGNVNLENVIANKEEIIGVKAEYEALTEGQKDFVETGAKDKLGNAVNYLEAAEAVGSIHAIGSVTKENAEEKKGLVEAAQKAYEALTDEQKALVPDDVKKILEDAKKAYLKPSESEKPNEPGKPSEPQNPGVPDGMENLTQKEKEQVDNIAGKLGVSQETAIQIWKYAAQMKIDSETLLLTERNILSTKSEKDLKGSKFGVLKAKAAKVNSNQVKLTWKKMKGADGYLIYQAECGGKKAYKKCKEVKNGNTASCLVKKLEKGKGYRFFIRAYKKADGKKITVSAAKTVHIVTSGGKKANVKSIKVSKSKATLKKGKSLKLKASEAKQKKPYAKCRKLCYESSNTKVATVSKDGKVKAKTKGKCVIYVYAQNGICKEVKVTVK